MRGIGLHGSKVVFAELSALDVDFAERTRVGGLLWQLMLGL
jgi:hypothetical protein